MEDDLTLCESITLASDKGQSESSLLALVKKFLGSGVSPNAPDEGGTTPVMAAAMKGYLSVVQCLVEAGADLSLKNQWKEDVITCAKLSDNKDLLKYLRSALKGVPAQAASQQLHFLPNKGTEAEYTFYPSKTFMAAHGSDEKDVGFFLADNEVLLLEPTKPPKSTKGLLTICIEEGKVTINESQWTVLSPEEAEKFLKKKNVSIHTIDNIVAEYLSD